MTPRDYEENLDRCWTSLEAGMGREEREPRALEYVCWLRSAFMADMEVTVWNGKHRSNNQVQDTTGGKNVK